MSAPGVVVRGWYQTDDGYADNDSFEHRFLEVCMTTLTIEAPVGLQTSRSALMLQAALGRGSGKS
jgi:hypothetical protein